MTSSCSCGGKCRCESTSREEEKRDAGMWRESFPRWAASLNRRAGVEQLMFDAVSGKREMPSREELRAWALKLGTPEEAQLTILLAFPVGSRAKVDHDGFEGTVIGSYRRKDGYEGRVIQQDGTKVVHVYGLKYLGPAEHAGS